MSTTKPLDPKTASELIALAQNGIPTEITCRALGITADDLEQWLEAGRSKKNTALGRFAEEYDKAQALGEIAILTKLNEHAKTDPSAAFKILEIREKAKERTEEKAPQGKPLQNARYEAFAQAYATGLNATEAYRKVTGKHRPGDREMASRLLTRVDGRIREIQACMAKRSILTGQRRLEICREVAESKTASHGDRLRAAKLDAELKGELIGKQELTGKDGEALPSIVPQIIVNLPPQMMGPRIAKGQ